MTKPNTQTSFTIGVERKHKYVRLYIDEPVMAQFNIIKRRQPETNLFTLLNKLLADWCTNEDIRYYMQAQETKEKKG